MSDVAAGPPPNRVWAVRFQDGGGWRLIGSAETMRCLRANGSLREEHEYAPTVLTGSETLAEALRAAQGDTWEEARAFEAEVARLTNEIVVLKEAQHGRVPMGAALAQTMGYGAGEAEPGPTVPERRAARDMITEPDVAEALADRLLAQRAAQEADGEFLNPVSGQSVPYAQARARLASLPPLAITPTSTSRARAMLREALPPNRLEDSPDEIAHLAHEAASEIYDLRRRLTTAERLVTEQANRAGDLAEALRLSETQQLVPLSLRERREYEAMKRHLAENKDAMG